MSWTTASAARGSAKGAPPQLISSEAVEIKTATSGLTVSAIGFPLAQNVGHVGRETFRFAKLPRANQSHQNVNAMRTFDVLLSFACKEVSIAPNYHLLSNGCSFI